MGDSDDDLGLSMIQGGPSLTNPLLKKGLEEGLEKDELSAVQQSALYIQDAVDGIVRVHPQFTRNAAQLFLIHLKIHPYAQTATALYVLLTFFELPHWCSSKPALCYSPLYPSFPINYLHVNTNFLVEMLIVSPIALDMFLCAFAWGKKMREAKMVAFRFVMLLLSLVDIIYAYLTPYDWMRMAPFLRILLFIGYHVGTRRYFQLMASMVKELVTLTVLVVVYIAFFALLAVLLFPTQGAGKNIGDAEGKTYMCGLMEAFWSLLILITTANFPDVMMPAYARNRIVAVFFMLFVVGGCFFLMNLVLAVVFNRYKDARDQERDKAKQARAYNLQIAFKILDDDNEEAEGFLTYQQMHEVFQELNRYHDIPTIDGDFEQILFDQLDRDDTDRIKKDEFLRLCAVLRLRFAKISKKTWFQRKFPSMAESKCFGALEKTVESPWMEYIIDGVLVLNLLTIIKESMGPIEGVGAYHISASSELGFIDLFFNLFFCCEAGAKILVLGDRYWASVHHRFDFMITAVTVGVTLYVYYPNDYKDKSVIRLVLMFRVLRILRLLYAIDAFRVLMYTLFHIVNQGKAILMALASVVYIFGCIGVIMFGGVINNDPNSQYYQAVKASDFADADYYPNNFNDLPSAVVCLFELLVVNNWFVISDGFVAATGYSSRIYFLLFYSVGVLLCLNVVVAWLLDTYVSAWENDKFQGRDRSAAFKEVEVTKQHSMETNNPEYYFVQQTGRRMSNF